LFPLSPTEEVAMLLCSCVLSLLAAFLVAGCDGATSPTTRDTPRSGGYDDRRPELHPAEKAPPLQGNDSAGRPLDLADYRGKVVLLTFWQTACPPCRVFHRQEVALAARYKDKPFALLGVNSDPDVETCVRTQEREGMSWPSLFPGRKAMRDWSVNGTPTIFLIDARGQLRYDSAGAPDAADLRRLIDDLLAEIK
jgi:thiol-disulfide isomerase/thioredoxin